MWLLWLTGPLGRVGGGCWCCLELLSSLLLFLLCRWLTSEDAWLLLGAEELESCVLLMICAWFLILLLGRAWAVVHVVEEDEGLLFWFLAAWSDDEVVVVVAELGVVDWLLIEDDETASSLNRDLKIKHHSSDHMTRLDNTQNYRALWGPTQTLV